jgi:hypothetical protein
MEKYMEKKIHGLLPTIEELGYVEEMRQRLGLEADDTSRDRQIEEMEPMERVRLLAGWTLGDPDWADTFKDFFESQGLYLAPMHGK